ncbi:MAG: c-type cytochrome [Xanthomonadales bacterium]|nr:c-type cytochrome [Xanthomonadales bacterium]
MLLISSLQAVAQGDAQAGQAKSAVCAACHGFDGNSTVPNWPKLAGQHETYLVRQITLIQSGHRQVPEMTAIVAGLSAQDIQDLAAYYASLENNGGVADEALVETGKRLFMAGNAETGTPACAACHGPAGEGNPLAVYPALAGQHAVYTAKMLRQYRDGVNWGATDAPSHVMNGTSKYLSDEEIDAVASYIQGLYRKFE